MFKSALFLLSEKLLRLVVTFFISVWFARYLGPTDYGNFSYVMSFGALLLPFFLMGSDETTIKALKEHPEKHNEVMGNTFKLKFTGGLIGLFLGGVLCFVLKGEGLILSLTIIYLIALLSKSFENIPDYFQSRLDIKFVSFSRNLVLIIVNLIKVGLILAGMSWEHFIYLSCFDVTVIVLFYIYKYYRTGHKIQNWTFNKDISLKETYIPIFLISFLIVAINKTDHLMIEYFVGLKSLGNYAVMNKFLELALFIPVAFLTSAYPALLKDHKSSKYQDTKALVYSLILNLALYALLFLMLLGPYTIKLLYGSAYDEAIELIPYYGINIIFIFIVFLRNKIFAVENILKSSLYNLSFIFIINICLNFLMIKQFGAKGAVISSILSYLIGNIFFIVVNKNFREEIKFCMKEFFHIYKIKNIKRIRNLK